MRFGTLANVSACRSIWLEAHSGPARQADHSAHVCYCTWLIQCIVHSRQMQ